MGSSICIWQYLSQTNNNCDNVPVTDRWKFVDDMTINEVINLVNIGMATFNVKTHVPSNIPSHNQFIPQEHLKTQKYLEEIKNWATDNQMKLNSKKTKNMIINFSTNKQFITNIELDGEVLETVNEHKILGTILTSNLSWERNTQNLIKGANCAMRLLHSASKFTRKSSDLKQIYTIFIRSRLETAVAVWHSGLTGEQRENLERVQKMAMRVIFKKQYASYQKSLQSLKLDTLEIRRQKLNMKFAKGCLKIDKLCPMFPLNDVKHDMEKRNNERYKVNHAKTERYRQSSIPYLQRLLNSQ